MKTLVSYLNHSCFSSVVLRSKLTRNWKRNAFLVKRLLKNMHSFSEPTESDKVNPGAHTADGVVQWSPSKVCALDPT